VAGQLVKRGENTWLVRVANGRSLTELGSTSTLQSMAPRKMPKASSPAYSEIATPAYSPSPLDRPWVTFSVTGSTPQPEPASGKSRTALTRLG
jgi:hypothetical protein